MDQFTMRGLTLNPAKTGITKGTTSTYTTTVTTACIINGKFATGLTAQTNTATPTTDAVSGAAFVALTDDKATVIVFGINAAGEIKMAQGSIVSTLPGSGATAGAFLDPPQFPAIPDTMCPIGYLLVRAAPSSSDWTAGTSSWTATGITASAVVEVAVLPERPQTS